MTFKVLISPKYRCNPIYQTRYLPPRKNETTAPKTPIKTKARMSKPYGTLDPVAISGVKVGIFIGGGDVKVG